MSFGRGSGSEGLDFRIKSLWPSQDTGASTSRNPCDQSYFSYVPGDFRNNSLMPNLIGGSSLPPPSTNPSIPTPFSLRPSASSYDNLNMMGTRHGRPYGSYEPAPRFVAGARFGSYATANIRAAASLAGPISWNFERIRQTTGVNLSIKVHESDPMLKNYEFEGTFNQIKHAVFMIEELTSSSKPGAIVPCNNFKTRLCVHFPSGYCPKGDTCKFAHGVEELRHPR